MGIQVHIEELLKCPFCSKCSHSNLVYVENSLYLHPHSYNEDFDLLVRLTRGGERMVRDGRGEIVIGNSTKTILSIIVAMSLSVLGLHQISEPEPANGSKWRIETVDGGHPSYGGFTSIALDGNNYPHISYQANWDLRYAEWTGSKWNVTIVDYNGSIGYDTSIALDSDDYPHISYTDGTNRSLKYARWDGNSWRIEVVDSGHHSKTQTSIELDKNDYAHITYRDPVNEDLRYAKWNGTKWDIQIVDSKGDMGWHSSLALDGNDNPHISYCDHGSWTFDLKYAKWTGINWSFETVDTGGKYKVGLFTSIALDSNDYPRTSYHNVTGELNYAEWNGSKWNIETVDRDDHVGDTTSIALDTQDSPHISYLDSNNGDLRYAKLNGNNWSIEIVDSDGTVGVWSSIGIDLVNNPHISYWDYTSGSLKYATKAKLAPPSRSITLNIDPDTLNLKSKGRWITAYLATDNAKADDIDAPSLLLNDVIRAEWWNIQNETILLAKFDRATVQSIVSVSDSIDIKVTGQWKDGERFVAHDAIRVINPGR
jgi:hypothetical protein